MKHLGEKTREILLRLGLKNSDLDEIETGDFDWDVINYPESSDSWMLLLRDGDGQRPIPISPECADELINTWDFERRTAHTDQRPTTFAGGQLEDWTGIRPDSDWHDLVRSYRRAASTLATQPDRELAAPYLFLCRHTLELQLKAIIMLGQQASGLVLDLPAHHDLQRLWTAAHPYIAARARNDSSAIPRLRELVEHYHAADRGSYSFRYPVTPKNRPVELEHYLHAFSKANHHARVDEAFGVLDRVIDRLYFACIFRRCLPRS